jgi:hypothetical protein
LPELRIGESRYREVLRELRHGIRQLLAAAAQSLSKPTAVSAAVSAAARSAARQIHRNEHCHRLSDCGAHRRIIRPVLHQSLFPPSPLPVLRGLGGSLEFDPAEGSFDLFLTYME